MLNRKISKKKTLFIALGDLTSQVNRELITKRMHTRVNEDIKHKLAMSWLHVFSIMPYKKRNTTSISIVFTGRKLVS